MTKKISISLNSSGMALLLCLLVITTLCLIGGAALSVSALNHQIVHNGTKQAQAFYTAEAGRELALACLDEDPMWRGGEVPASGSFEGEFSTGGGGVFKVSLSDCTADENGIYNELLPAGHVALESTGSWTDALTAVSCIVRITPKAGTEAVFPRAAVVSSGSITGPLTALDDLGDEDSLLIQTPTFLPEVNADGLRAMADMVFTSLDDDVWDAALDGIGTFWRDAPANTSPHIFFIQGDLELSGDRQVCGIVFVEGENVTLDGESGIQGVLYAPNATDVRVSNTGVSGRIVVSGQVSTGAGGLTVSGNQASFQHDPDYVDAFNIVAGSQVNIDVVPGSWRSH